MKKHYQLPNPWAPKRKIYNGSQDRFLTCLARQPELLTYDELVKAACRADNDNALMLEKSVQVYS